MALYSYGPYIVMALYRCRTATPSAARTSRTSSFGSSSATAQRSCGRRSTRGTSTSTSCASPETGPRAPRYISTVMAYLAMGYMVMAYIQGRERRGRAGGGALPRRRDGLARHARRGRGRRGEYRRQRDTARKGEVGGRQARQGPVRRRRRGACHSFIGRNYTGHDYIGP